VFALANDRRESPHKLPVSIFKEQPRASAEADRELCGILQSCQHRPADISAGALLKPTTGRPGSLRKGAQYNDALRRVNRRVKTLFFPKNLTTGNAAKTGKTGAGVTVSVAYLQGRQAHEFDWSATETVTPAPPPSPQRW